jgi:hypothetical protein
MNWFIPLLLIAILIWPLRQLERWMHKHLQGLGLLLTNNPQAAVLIYYLLLLPGVALHEASQWLLAKILRVKIKRFQLWPEKQKGGIKLGMVEIEKDIDATRATMIGMIPVVAGCAVIAWIGSTRFDLPTLATAFASQDLGTILAGLNVFISTPDFWLWVYLVFAIANAMMPEAHDVINWWILIVPFAGLIAFLLVLDQAILVAALMEGPVAAAGSYLSLALGIALAVDLLVMGLIALTEAIFSRVLDRELEYT